MALTESDLKAIREILHEVLADAEQRIVNGIDARMAARMADDEPLTPEVEREVLGRMASNEPGIAHDEAMCRVFGAREGDALTIAQLIALLEEQPDHDRKVYCTAEAGQVRVNIRGIYNDTGALILWGDS